MWPLDVVDDLEMVCLPATDLQVLRRGTSSILADPSLPLAPELPRLLPQESGSEVDELQHISNVLFQPSPAVTPACSPAIHGLAHPLSGVSAIGAAHHLPTGESLPSSSCVGPTRSEHEASIAEFQLPPTVSMAPPLATGSPRSAARSLPRSDGTIDRMRSW